MTHIISLLRTHVGAMDKSTAQSIVPMHYPREVDTLEGFLFCKEMLCRTAIFGILDAFMSEARQTWEKLAFCTDGAAAMTNQMIGRTTQMKSVNRKIMAADCSCIKHRLPKTQNLFSVSNTAVTTVSCVQSRAQQSPLFGLWKRGSSFSLICKLLMWLICELICV